MQIQPLGRLLELEGTGGSATPYLGYVEVNLQIPGIKNYNEDVLLLVIPTTTYSEKVQVVVGSKIIDWAMGVITKGDLVKATMTWRQAHFGAVMSRLLQLPHTNSNGSRVEKEVIHSSLGVDTMEVKEFCLDNVWGPVQYCQYTQLYQWQGTLYVDPCAGRANTRSPAAHISGANYDLQRITSGVLLGIHLFAKLSTCSIEIPTKTGVGQVMSANQVPLVVLPVETSGRSTCTPKRMDLGSHRPPRPRGMAQS